MDTELDRTYDPFKRNQEFEDWLDEMDRLTAPDRIEAERLYWERRGLEQVEKEEAPF